MGTTTEHYVVKMGDENQPPVARVLPVEQSNALGSVVQLTGEASYDPESAVLDFTWSFLEAPIGSELTDDGFDSLNDTGSVVSFTPDLIGIYRVSLVVSDGELDSDVAEGYVRISPVLAPVCTDLTPDAKHIFRWVTDFLGLIEDKEVFSILWSALLQIWGDQLLAGLQVDYNKSIHTAQELFQRRWQHYDPRLALAPSLHYVVVGNQQDGTHAVTGGVGRINKGILLSDATMLVLEGVVSVDYVSYQIQVVDSNGIAPGNNGVYTIARARTDRSQYQLSGATRLPDVTADVITTGNDLVAVAGSDLVTSALTDFSLFAGFESGDVIRIGNEYIIIDAVGVAGGLPDNSTLQLRSAPTSPGAGLAFTVYNLVTLRLDPLESMYTDTFFMPQSDGDLSLLNSGEITGYADITNITEVVVGVAKVFDDAVGKTIQLDGDQNNGAFVVGSVNEAGDGYHIVSAFGGTFPQEGVAFTLEEVGSADGRIVVVNGRSATLRRAYNDDLQPNPPTGPGPVTVGVATEALLLSGLEDVEWRLPATLYSEQYDFEDMGVQPGDLLVGELYRPDTGAVANVYASVVSVDGPRLGFEVTRQDITAGTDLDLSDEEKYTIAESLGLEGATLDLLGALELEGDAQDVADAYNSTAFGNQYYNVPVRDSLGVVVGPLTLQVRAKFVVRNSWVPVHNDLVSSPCLSEYIAKPVVYENEEGAVTLVTKEGATKELDLTPFKLVENREFTIGPEDAVWGRDGDAVAGSPIFTSAAGDFLNRVVAAGDTLELRGFNAGHYAISEVLSSTQVRIGEEATGAAPTISDGDVEWYLTRRRPGNFIRFVPGLFSPAWPAPARLWSEVSFFDNGQILEDNFGHLVKLSREDLSSRESTGISYKDALEGLMYAWSFGPRVEMVRVGAQLLLGLATSEKRGEITEIREDYQTDPTTGVATLGRILVEDVDVDDNTTGLIRVYFFTPTTDEADENSTGVAINPVTGTRYTKGDVVEKFTPLARGVEVLDYVNSPTWWAGMGSQGVVGAELRKYHTWRLLANVDVIDYSDLKMTADFVRAIRAVWTEVDAVMFKLLVDDVTISDTVEIEGSLLLFDNPGMGLEAALGFGYSHHGHQLMDFGESIKASRVLFTGWDLETVAGVAEVTSARGGFLGDLEEPPNPYFSEVPETTAVTAPDLLTSNQMVRGVSLYHEGDILHILEGDNAGRYEIEGVPGNKELSLRQAGVAPSTIPALPPLSPDPTQLKKASGQKFMIERRVRYPLMGEEGGAGLGVEVSSVDPVAYLSYDTGVGSAGLAVGDRLVVVDNYEATYEIRNITDEAGVVRLDLDRPALLPGITDDDFKVFRPVMLANPLCAGVVHAHAGQNVTLGEDLWGHGVSVYDYLYILTGPEAGHRFRIIDLPVAGDSWVQEIPGANLVGAEWEIRREELGDTPLTFGKVLEVLPWAKTELVLYDPKFQIVVAVADMQGMGGTAAVSPSTDLQAAGALPGDFLELGNPAQPTDTATGVFEVATAGPAVSLTKEVGNAFSGTNARILRRTADFNVNLITVTSVAGTNFANLGVLPGDVVELWENPGDTPFVRRVLSAAAGTITLTRTMGVVALRFGRIIRREEN
jgi:hypothetical protein